MGCEAQILSEKNGCILSNLSSLSVTQCPSGYEHEMLWMFPRPDCGSEDSLGWAGTAELQTSEHVLTATKHAGLRGSWSHQDHTGVWLCGVREVLDRIITRQQRNSEDLSWLSTHHSTTRCRSNFHQLQMKRNVLSFLCVVYIPPVTEGFGLYFFFPNSIDFYFDYS